MTRRTNKARALEALDGNGWMTKWEIEEQHDELPFDSPPLSKALKALVLSGELVSRTRKWAGIPEYRIPPNEEYIEFEVDCHVCEEQGRKCLAHE